MANNNPIELDELLNEKVIVNLKGGQELKGTLSDYDNYMNLVLKKVEEHRRDGEVKKHEVMIVKGGNIRSITS